MTLRAGRLPLASGWRRVVWRWGGDWAAPAPREKSSLLERSVHVPCRAASAACANRVMRAKNSADCPMKRPSLVKALTVPMAAPSVWVGRMIETIGNLRSRKGVGSGAPRLGQPLRPPPP